MADFTFTQISNVDPNSNYILFANSSINDGGTVVFEAFTPLTLPFLPPEVPPIPFPTILSGNGGAATPVTETRFDTAFQASINNQGTTSFGAASGINSTFIPTNTGIYTSNNGNLQNLVNNSGEFITFGPTSINNKGDVAFYATLGSQETGIFAGYNGQIQPIAQSSDNSFNNFTAGLNCTTVSRGAGPFCSYSSTSINDQGTVAFTAGLDAGGTGIFTGNGGATTTIADTTSDLFKDFNFQTFGSADINNAGTVAFLAAFDADADGTASSGIFLSDNGKIATLADTSGVFGSFGSDPAINDKGMVAFLAGLDNGVTGIFTGTDPIADQVIAVGDEFFGSTVTSLSISQQGLNNNGAVAFSATLADGRQGIFRAEEVPEPSDGIVSVLALGILFTIGQRWRRRKQSPKPAGNVLPPE